MRPSVGKTAPQMPMTSYDGVSPTAIVEAPMMNIVNTRSFFRPTRSPKWPKIAAPIGRATKPTKNVVNDSIVATNGSEPGKNFRGNTAAAATGGRGAGQEARRYRPEDRACRSNPRQRDRDPHQRQPEVRGDDRQHEPGRGEQAGEREVLDLPPGVIDPCGPRDHRDGGNHVA